MNTRKQYSKEYKLDAVSLVLDQGYSVTEAAMSLEINRSVLQRWVREFQPDDGQAFRGNGKLTPEQAEIRRLKEENRRLKMEKDILKSDGLLRQGNAMKYAFITRYKKTWPVDYWVSHEVPTTAATVNEGVQNIRIPSTRTCSMRSRKSQRPAVTAIAHAA